jgi:hypothetical protein
LFWGWRGESRTESAGCLRGASAKALANGEPLVTATAHARRVGLADGAPPDSSVDWGFPALFLAEGVEPSYVPVAAQPNDPAVQIHEWITGYDLEEEPVFCGREEYLQAYHELFRRPGEEVPRHQVLAVYVRPTNGERYGRCGRTRLLKELAIHALHDGHVPVLVTVPASSEPPRTPEAFGAAMSAAITQVRSDNVLGLGRRRGQLDLMRRTTGEVLQAADLDGDIAYELESHGVWTAAAVRRGIQLDLLSLRRDAARQCPTTADGQVVVLLDEVERYAGVLEHLFSTMLNGYGLGSPREPIPVVLAFSLGQATNDVLVPIAEQRFTKPWLRAMPLEPFRDGEDMLAYELVLLNPYRELPDDEDQIASRPWTFNPSVAADVRTFWERQFRRRLKGFPDALGSELLYDLVLFAKQQAFVVDADDEAFLRRIPFE